MMRTVWSTLSSLQSGEAPEACRSALAADVAPDTVALHAALFEPGEDHAVFKI
jgi:hypothetical protein